MKEFATERILVYGVAVLVALAGGYWISQVVITTVQQTAGKFPF